MKALIDIELVLDANGEWHLNPIDFANFLEEENII
jgi:L-alanine-DL-glutamate epimerase-like enolase superfamily enzyme